MLRAAHAGIVDGNNGVSGMVGGGRREILDPPRVTAGAMGELDPSRVYVGDRSGGCRALRRRRAGADPPRRCGTGPRSHAECRAAFSRSRRAATHIAEDRVGDDDAPAAAQLRCRDAAHDEFVRAADRRLSRHPPVQRTDDEVVGAHSRRRPHAPGKRQMNR
jgi:hypothetical protein